jgi:hypothetical protein
MGVITWPIYLDISLVNSASWDISPLIGSNPSLDNNSSVAALASSTDSGFDNESNICLVRISTNG